MDRLISMDLKAVAMGVVVSLAVVICIAAVKTGVVERGPYSSSCFMLEISAICIWSALTTRSSYYHGLYIYMSLFDFIQKILMIPMGTYRAKF